MTHHAGADMSKAEISGTDQVFSACRWDGSLPLSQSKCKVFYGSKATIFRTSVLTYRNSHQRHMFRRDFLTVAGAASGLLPHISAFSQQLSQTALVIGNDEYHGNARLTNAGNDARLMHETFSKLGADSKLFVNLPVASMTQRIEEYLRSMRQRPGIAWFFYAGHGVQFDKRNLLLGTDAGFTSKQEVEAGSYNLDTLLSVIELVRPQVAVVIVDACRDNPFELVRTSTRGIPLKGLAELTQRSGVLVAYSTSPYNRAQDWPEAKNGPYVAALSRALLSKGRSLEGAFRETSDEVQKATSSRMAASGEKPQVPWYSSSLRSEVWLEQSQVSIRALPAQPVLASGGGVASPRGISATGVRTYRSDMKVARNYPDMTPADWSTLLARLEQKAASMDSNEAAHALARTTSNDEAATLSGLLAQEGRVRAKNNALAIASYERAGKNGYVPAQVLLGELQYQRKDFGEAYKWLSEAASHGVGRAEMDLGQLSMENGDMQAAAAMLKRAFTQQMPSNDPQDTGMKQPNDLAQALRQQFNLPGNRSAADGSRGK